MPTYEYRCPKGHNFELFQRMSDPPEAQCPECGKAAERLLSAGAGFLFKGSGFYITDYRSDSYKKKAESESKSASQNGKPSGSDSGGKDSGSGSSPKKESGAGSSSSSSPTPKTDSGKGSGSSSGSGSS